MGVDKERGGVGGGGGWRLGEGRLVGLIGKRIIFLNRYAHLEALEHEWELLSEFNAFVHCYSDNICVQPDGARNEIHTKYIKDHAATMVRTCDEGKYIKDHAATMEGTCDEMKYIKDHAATMVRTCDEGKYIKDHAATMVRTCDEVKYIKDHHINFDGSATGFDPVLIQLIPPI